MRREEGRDLTYDVQEAACEAGLVNDCGAMTVNAKCECCSLVLCDRHQGHDLVGLGIVQMPRPDCVASSSQATRGGIMIPKYRYMGQIPSEDAVPIVVLDDGETYQGKGWVVYLTPEQLERVDGGEKIRHVVSLEDWGIPVPMDLSEASLQKAAREFLEGGDPGIDPTTAIALVDERPQPDRGPAPYPLTDMLAEFATLLLQGQLTGGER